MPDQPPSERFKAEMPQIPGVPAPGSPPVASHNSSLKLGIGLIAVLLAIFLGARWALRPQHTEPKPARPPQIEVPSPAPDPNTLLPHATDTAPGIASVEEMAKPWSSKEFFIRNGLTGENTPGMLIRLPTGSATQASGYWAFSVRAPYGDCRLEYVTDLAKLKTDYGFRAAKHPMVGNPCTRTLFDPLRMTTLPGNFFVRGAILLGSDLRPPMGIEIRVRGKDILAIRTE
jgi:hypothetical protein